MSRWTRRAEVAALLAGGTKSKLAGQDSAMAPLERAYALTRRPDRLHAPWPAVTAYRLAHALLNTGPDAGGLSRVVTLFDEATAFGHLGPWPHVFGLAARHRTNATDADLQAAFVRAFESYRSWVAKEPLQTGATAAGVHLQTARTDLFNLLDLAACFIGADRSPLRGHGLRHDLPGSDSPCLVIAHPSGGAIALAPSVARAELDVLRTEHPEAVAFDLPAFGEPCWWLRGQACSATGLTEMRLLVSLLLHDCGSADALALKVTGRADSVGLAALRQARRRLRDRLARGGLTLKPEDLTTRDDHGRWGINCAMPIFGLVSVARYRDPE